MKHDWEYKRFNDIMRPAKSERCGERVSLPVLSITMREGIIFQKDRFKKVVASRETSGYKVVKRGQLVIAFPIDEGLIYTQTVADEGIMSPAYNVWDVDYGLVNGRFLEMYLHSQKMFHYYKEKLRGTTQRRRMLPKEDLLSIPIPVPPLPIQQQIVAELDKVSEIIEKKKQQVKELDNLAQSIFYAMFGDPVENEMGWEVKKMNEVAPPSEYKGEHPNKDDKYWLLNLDKVEAQTGRILDFDYYTPEEIGNSVISFDKSNILYSKLRPYLNKVVIPEQIGYATSELVPLKPQGDILNRYYLAYMLRSKTFVSYINIKVAGAKMPRVSMSVFRDFPVPLPPLPLQQTFAQKVEAIEKQKELITESIKEAQTLFDARMDYWFGE